MVMIKREIFAKEILNDIKSGMDDVNLMQKYKVTVKGLDGVFRKLLTAGLISERELNSRKLGFEETVICRGSSRSPSKEAVRSRRERKKNTLIREWWKALIFWIIYSGFCLIAGPPFWKLDSQTGHPAACI